MISKPLGLNPETCQIIQIGAVIDDLTKPEVPVEELPHFYKNIGHDSYQGEAFALHMNSRIFEQLAIGDDKNIMVSQLPKMFAAFLMHHFESKFGSLLDSVTFAGKNFASFDARFLNKIEGFDTYFRIAHRTIDPAMMYMRREDTKIPNLQTCCDRAGIELDSSLQHDALYDAQLVTKLVRKGLQR